MVEDPLHDRRAGRSRARAPRRRRPSRAARSPSTSGRTTSDELPRGRAQPSDGQRRAAPLASAGDRGRSAQTSEQSQQVRAEEHARTAPGSRTRRPIAAEHGELASDGRPLEREHDREQRQRVRRGTRALSVITSDTYIEDGIATRQRGDPDAPPGTRAAAREEEDRDRDEREEQRVQRPCRSAYAVSRSPATREDRRERSPGIAGPSSYSSPRSVSPSPSASDAPPPP